MYSSESEHHVIKVNICPNEKLWKANGSVISTRTSELHGSEDSNLPPQFTLIRHGSQYLGPRLVARILVDGFRWRPWLQEHGGGSRGLTGWQVKTRQ